MTYYNLNEVTLWYICWHCSHQKGIPSSFGKGRESTINKEMYFFFKIMMKNDVVFWFLLPYQWWCLNFCLNLAKLTVNQLSLAMTLFRNLPEINYSLQRLIFVIKNYNNIPEILMTGKQQKIFVMTRLLRTSQNFLTPNKSWFTVQWNTLISKWVPIETFLYCAIFGKIWILSYLFFFSLWGR